MVEETRQLLLKDAASRVSKPRRRSIAGFFKCIFLKEEIKMKGAYPVFIEKTDDGYYAKIPDFDIGTQGSTIPDAMEMARDAIGLMGIDMEDDKKEIPQPYSRKVEPDEGDIVTLVD
ncbi:type II toxin-antitoxin system HicB family antitoxin, partial [Phascolarctobacterium succinatutens]|uniref:type II toxin-antitoxin system HicB family antitoxin n=1 Tax=Phascolarctobacterium succinatutens TaxID=626940 RepID=UPI003AEF174F